MQTTSPTASTSAAYDASATRVVPQLNRVVVGVRGATSDEGVMRAAAAIARRHGSQVTAATVFRPRVLAPPRALTRRHPMEEGDRREAAAWLRGVRTQLRRARHAHERWRVYRAVGDPGTEIARAAARLEAELTVIGLGRETAEAREYGSHVALRLAQLAGAPLLAVARGCSSVWHTAVALLDGRPHDAAVLHATASLLARPARIVALAPPVAGDAHGGQESEISGARVEYERVASTRELEATALAACSTRRADVIALPLYGDSPPVRALTNHRALRLLSDARCSVLLVPDGGWSPDLLD
jgi:hypothetical protein